MTGAVLLTEAEAAARLGLSLKTLCNLRTGGRIAYCRVSPRLIRYRPCDLEQFLERSAQEANPNPPPRALPRRESLPTRPCVYFVRSGLHGPIKIGFARSLRHRLYALGTAHHEELILLATMAGGAVQEARLHKQFAALRTRGEWFEPAEELLSFIEALQDWQ